MAGPCGSEAYSVKEVARLLGVSDQTVRTAAEDGRLPENWREGSGARAPYCFGKPAIDALDGVLPGSRLRRLSPDRNEAELVALVDRLRREAADERTRRALADQRVIFLEREVERLQGALRDVVERFTRPELPDGPDAR